MNYLYNNKTILRKIKKSNKILLFLDYDGTLTPIVSKPEAAVLSHRTKKILKILSNDCRFILVVITGRSVSDIKKLVGINRIIYIGNHGFEIKLPGKDILSPGDTKKLMKEVSADIKCRIKNVMGAYLEDKGLTLSLHWRNVDKADNTNLRKITRGIKEDYSSRLRFIKGKKVLNLVPLSGIDKGKIVNALLTQTVSTRNNVSIVYIGDDVTDEYAFRELKGKGITIRVGRNIKSSARYYLNNTGEVYKFLYFLKRMY
ncbi:MAG: trehalose-phosphatase [Elusimicrobia bacterium CG1_02_37_114]|nr:MAG: trehalose-phosphatase [Elusimicrobia bacterium CG1_02_37_114]PIV52780.1 MAG: trehalose-phosphatase [Elusimicrobia bacterium CG02_land_8_20_14_3_00_37_13]